MRTKVRELPCSDETGHETLVIEWRIQSPGLRSEAACCAEFTLEDGSPVSPLGGKFEHFYSGRLFTPR